jgi:hypothetical protein
MLVYQSSFFRHPHAKQKFLVVFAVAPTAAVVVIPVIIGTPSERIVISVSTISFDIVV